MIHLPLSKTGGLVQRSKSGRTRTVLLVALSTLLSSSLVGCEYWWQRGQPPAVAKLMGQSQEKLQTAAAEFKTARAAIIPTSLTLADKLNRAVTGAQKKEAPAALLVHLKEARAILIELDGKLSVGSRAAQNELNGQLRTIIERAEKGEKTDVAALGLYTARVQSFLANELSVPAPVGWTAQPKA